MTDDMEWMPINTLPPPGERPGRVFVVVEGEEHHSGSIWYRQMAGIARTQNVGFNPDDIALIESQDHMTAGTGDVTHWMPWCLPHLPQRTN
jgi:hypothetical protein